jgi:hypothetical protein
MFSIPGRLLWLEELFSTGMGLPRGHAFKGLCESVQKVKGQSGKVSGERTGHMKIFPALKQLHSSPSESMQLNSCRRTIRLFDESHSAE